MTRRDIWSKSNSLFASQCCPLHDHVTRQLWDRVRSRPGLPALRLVGQSGDERAHPAPSKEGQAGLADSLRQGARVTNSRVCVTLYILTNHGSSRIWFCKCAQVIVTIKVGDILDLAQYPIDTELVPQPQLKVTGAPCCNTPSRISRSLSLRTKH